MRLSSIAFPSEIDDFEKRTLAARFERRFETALEVQFRRVENLLRSMDTLTSPRGGRF
jgi:hypothetical protein